MKNLSKLSSNPDDPFAVMQAIQYAWEAAAKLNLIDLLPDDLQDFVVKVDHIGLSAGIQTLPALLKYQNTQDFSIRSFNSEIASREFNNSLTIYELKGGFLPLEIMVPSETNKKFSPPHIAFEIKREEDFKNIILLLKRPFALPPFMNGIMENKKENISMIYLDGGEIRFEFKYFKNRE